MCRKYQLADEQRKEGKGEEAEGELGAKRAWFSCTLDFSGIEL